MSTSLVLKVAAESTNMEQKACSFSANGYVDLSAQKNECAQQVKILFLWQVGDC